MHHVKHLKGAGYDAVGIEHSFAIFMQAPVGNRGLPYDADVFRAGGVAALGDTLERMADHFQQRVGGIRFGDTGSGSPAARLNVAIQSLRSLSKDMKASSGKEPEDYHWIAVGHLVLAIASLLDVLGV